MYLINTEDASPYAIGRWTDINQPSPHLKTQMLNRRDPFLEMIDSWGKLDSGFNNEISEDFNVDNNEENINPEYNKLEESNYDKYKIGNRPNYDLLRQLAKKKFNFQTTSKPPGHVRTNSKSPSIEHSQFVEEYKSNLSKGIVNPEVFNVPVRLDY